MTKEKQQYMYLKGKITGALRALVLSEKSESIRGGLRDILDSFIELTDGIEGISNAINMKTFKNVKDAKRLK
jgi:hypothetical protein